ALSVAFGIGNSHCGTSVSLARADGTAARQLTTNALGDGWFAGSWLYYEDRTDKTISLYRVRHPEGAPELLASFPSPQRPPNHPGPWLFSLDSKPSPDGDAIAYCDPYWASCSLLPPGNTTSIS